MSESDRKVSTDGEVAARRAWEPMRLEYLGHVTELVAGPSDQGTPGKASAEGHEGPLPGKKAPGAG
jgi:hypothetical protein